MSTEERRPPTTSHNYQRKITELAERGKLNAGGALLHIDVKHDDWCDALNERGFCNCDPIVSTRVEGGN